MQKKIIALAIAAAFSAPAFADTTVYGIVDVGFGSVSNSPTAAGGASGVKTGESGTAFSQNQTSRVGVKATEDVGNGMKASYQLEMGLSSNPASTANFGSGAIGTANNGFTTNTTIGPDRVLAATLDLGQGTTIIGGKISSPLRNIAYGNDAQYGSNLIGNLVTMDSVLTARATTLAVAQNFGSVVATAALLDNTITKDGVADVKTGNGYELSAVFGEGPLSVSGAYRSTKTAVNAAAAVAPVAGNVGSAAVNASDATTKAFIVAANYNFGMAKVYGQYATVQVDESLVTATTVGKKTYETLGVNVPFTSTFAGYVEASFGKNDQHANGAATDSRNYSAYGVGVRYDLSKATWLYAHVGSAKLDNTTLSAGSKVDQVALGLVKSF